MYQVLNAENRDKMVQAAMVSRCFIVGFRYFRQSEMSKFRLLQVLAQELGAVLGEQRHVFIESLAISTFLTAVAAAHDITEPEAWAADVMFLISPAMWRPQDMSLLEGNEAWAITISAVPAELANFSLAVGGNVFMSSEYNRIFDKHSPVFDEDIYPGASQEYPVIGADFRTNWRQLLTERRMEQFQKYVEFVERVVEVDTPLVQSPVEPAPTVALSEEDDLDR